MKVPHRITTLLARCSLLVLMSTVAGAMIAAGQTPERKSGGSPFAKGNLHAWAFEEYDAAPRTPSERAQLLRSLGLRRAGYVGRNVERMEEFDAYVKAYREHEIDLVAVWTPVNTEAPLQEPHIRKFLEAAERQQIRGQWWVTLEQFTKGSDDQTVDRAVALLRPLVSEAAKRGLRLAVYGHGRDSWFTQPENEIAIVERLASFPGEASVGIAYNFHHAHSQLDRFAAIFPKLAPHLIAVNLNGLRPEGPMILPINEGTREQEMIAIIHRSGFRGPVGVLHHQRTMEASAVLRKNMEGLRDILKRIGDMAAASTY
jgi:sugar phosphate isomerase/epimerase